MASALASCSFRPSVATPRGVAPLRRNAAFKSAASARRARTVVAPKALLNEIVQVTQIAARSPAAGSSMSARVALHSLSMQLP